MTINQLAALMVTLFVAGMGFLKYYLDAKFDPISIRLSDAKGEFKTHKSCIFCLLRE